MRNGRDTRRHREYGGLMTSANRFRLESGPFLMEVTGVASGWIARLDGAGEHYKSTFSDEAAAKEACLEAARSILHRKNLGTPASLVDPNWI